MKKIYKKEEGVSPVIATILMVAITVVLAATVWLLVSGYMGGTTQPNLAVSLVYDVEKSDPASGVVYIKVSMSTPSTASWTKVVIGINGKTDHLTDQTTTFSSGDLNGYTVEIQDLDGNGMLSSGDVIIITAPTGTDLSGATISIAIDGYSGSQQLTVPS